RKFFLINGKKVEDRDYIETVNRLIQLLRSVQSEQDCKEMKDDCKLRTNSTKDECKLKKTHKDLSCKYLPFLRTVEFLTKTRKLAFVDNEKFAENLCWLLVQKKCIAARELKILLLRIWKKFD